ncbi:MAG: Lrp/AsnC family transcriptional regulator [Asgard group archaeon]|nr:Lrp/AsnC family transcriptional regulator [Asgard group archaeon]
MSTDSKETFRAYILMTIKLGSTNDVLAKLKKIPGITSISVITGEFDVIVRLETDSFEEMYDRTQEIHLIDGIDETTTSIIQKEF